MGCMTCTRYKTIRNFQYDKQISSAKSPPKALKIKCLNIQIQEPLHIFLYENYLQHSPRISNFCSQHMSHLAYIKTVYSKMLSFEHHFKQLVHSVCISPKLSSYMKIMLISIRAGMKEELLINSIESYPFISVSLGEIQGYSLEIYSSFRNYVKIIEEVGITSNFSFEEAIRSIKEVTAKLHKSKESFNIIEYRKCYAFLLSVIELSEKMRNDVKHSVQKLKKFSVKLKKYETGIRDLGLRAKDLEYFTGKEISHLILDNYRNFLL